MLATLGIDIRFLADNQGSPGAEIQGAVLRGASFWVDVRVQDVRTTASQGVIALPLNMSWDPTLFQFAGDSNLSAQGSNPLPLDDPLVTGQFPLQRAVSAFDATAAAFDPAADPNTLLEFFNLRGVRGAALPNAGQGQPIGVGTAESFSQLRFVAIANQASATFTVNLDGSMAFADADPLEDFTGIGNTADVDALANTVAASIPISGGSISGTKFNDANGNGMRDMDETGVAGVTILLMPTDPQGTVRESQTGNDGSYVFDDLAAGMFTISEMVPNDSWLTTPANNSHLVTLEQGNATAQDLDFGNFTMVTLGGTKFNDANENGVRDAGELGLAGVTIRLDLNSDGDTPDDRTQVTDADGTYQFANVGPGTHTVTEDVPAGFRQTLPSGGAYAVTPVSGQDQNGLDFGNAEIIVATVSGTKFDDLDGDSVRDAGEPGQAGVTIRLDLNNDGTGDRETTTATDGMFQFNEVPSGTHAVSEVLPGGSVRTAPDTVPIIVTVDQDSSVTGLLFGNFQLTNFGGMVFNDLDQDGNRDTGEPVLPGVTIELDLGNDGSADQTVITGSDGRYQFNNIGPGTHLLREVIPNGFLATSPNPSQYLLENQSGQSQTDLDFGNAVTGASSSILGFVYSDVDFNGQFDAGEFGLPNVTVQLFLDGAVTPLQTTTTAADGSYFFADLAAGTYRVTEVQPSRFHDASITRGTVLPSGQTRGTTVGFNRFEGISLGDQETAIDYNFGEVLTAVTKKMFLTKTNPRAELARNSGLVVESILGTPGDDQIRVEHLADSRWRVTVNKNAPIDISVGQAEIVLVDGLGGMDSMTYVGNDQDETIRATPSQVAVTTLTQMLGVFNVPQIRVEGGGGVDRAVLRDTTASDQLTASGNTAVLTSPNNQRIELVQLDTIQAISAVDANQDRANVAMIDFVLQLSGDWQ